MEIISPSKEIRTDCKQFNDKGYLILPSLTALPIESSQQIIDRFPRGSKVGFKDKQVTVESEQQVKDSIAIFNNPEFAGVQDYVCQIVSSLLGVTLLPTYYYERFYFDGQELIRHRDRAACEVSVTMHLDNNLNPGEAAWPIYFQAPDKSIVGFDTAAGDAVVYKGRVLEHWRAPLKTTVKDGYYRQLFLHYVVKGGHCHHLAGNKFAFLY